MLLNPKWHNYRNLHLQPIRKQQRHRSLQCTTLAGVANLHFAVWPNGYSWLHFVLFYCFETQKGRECRYHSRAADLECSLLLALNLLFHGDSQTVVKLNRYKLDGFL